MIGRYRKSAAAKPANVAQDSGINPLYQPVVLALCEWIPVDFNNMAAHVRSRLRSPISQRVYRRQMQKQRSHATFDNDSTTKPIYIELMRQ